MGRFYSNSLKLAQWSSHFLLYQIFFLGIISVIGFLIKPGTGLLFSCCTLSFIFFFLVPAYQSLSYEVVNNGDLKIISFNLLSSNPNKKKVIQWIEKEQPDILFLMEVTSHWENSLSTLKKTYPFNFIESREDNFGFALFSKYPLTQTQKLVFSKNPLKTPHCFAKVQIQNREIGILGVHAFPPINIPVTQIRNNDLNELSQFSLKEKIPLIVLGDFNSTRWDYDFIAKTHSRFQDSRSLPGTYPTWPAVGNFAILPLDHLFFSKEFLFIDRKTGLNLGSDHLPVIAWLRLKKP